MDVEYKKDLRHNYMVIIENEPFKIEPYCIKMLEQQQIEGVLPLEQRSMDNKILFYYDITAKQSMKNLLEKVALSYEKVSQLISGILSTIEKAYEYLLPEDDFILSPEFIYLDVVTYAPSLCFLSEYRKGMKEQLNLLLEYLMNKVDYNDKDAVFLVYQLYAVSREDGFTFDHLFEVLHKQSQPASGNRSIKNRNFGEKELNNEDKQNNERQNPDKQTTDKPAINRQNADGQRKNGQYLGRPYENENSKSRHHSSGQVGDIETLLKQKLPIDKISDKVGFLHKNRRQQSANANQNKKETVNYPMADQQKKKEYRMSVMMEKLEGETEVLYYPVKTYLYTAACIIGGISFVILGFTTKILYNTFGNRVDFSKLFALLLILFCVEGYLIKMIWDKKNKHTKFLRKSEYIDPRQEPENIKTGLMIKKAFPDEDKKFPVQQQETKKSPSREGAIESKERYNINDKTIHADNSYNVVSSEKYEVEKDEYEKDESNEEDNPTCLLNEEVESTKIILKPLDEARYHTISITAFPFFVGKLKKNVDYCLEKDVVSRFHAKITKEQEQYYITDLNSTNGTFVNQEVVQTYQREEIKFGDEIAFANIKYRFQKN